MANEENLRAPSTEEARARGAKGGVASGKARREKKAMKETLETLLSMPLEDGKADDLEQIKSIAALKGKNITVQDAIMFAQIKRALKGDTRAAEFIRDASGNKLAEAIDGKGKVAILTQPSAELHAQRCKGYEEALKEYSDIEVVQIGDTKSDPVVAIDVAKAMLQANPDIVGIGCTDAVGGAAVATALEELGMVGKVKVITMDRDQQVLEKIKDGTIYGTLVQNSALMPFLALEILYNMKHADVAVTTAGFKFAPATIDTGVVFVDASTAEYYMRSNTSGE